MGTPAKKMVYDFKRKFNSVNSGRNVDIPLVDIIAYLNEAMEVWYEHRIPLAQTTSKVRRDLSVFKKDMIQLELSERSRGAVFAKYPEDLYKRLNQISRVSKDECCKGHDKEIIPRIITSDDLHEGRRNVYRKANFFFEQLFCIDADGGLLIYHDDEMKVDEVYIDYYRKPKPIHAPSLEKCDDGVYYDYCGVVITEDSDFEVSNTFAANNVVDIAVLMASKDTHDMQSFNMQLNSILGQSNLAK